MGTFSLRFIGAQLAHLTYELVEWRNEQLKQELLETYRREMDQRWAVVEDELTRRALHRKFVTVNRLDINAPSPYLLLVSSDEGGENLNAVPLAASSTPLPMPSDNT